MERQFSESERNQVEAEFARGLMKGLRVHELLAQSGTGERTLYDSFGIVNGADSARRGRGLATRLIIEAIRNGLVTCDDLPQVNPNMQLNRSEVRVLALMTGGYTAEEIAQMLQMGYSMVNQHKSHISKKLGFKTSYQAIAYGALAIRAHVGSGEFASNV